MKVLLGIICFLAVSLNIFAFTVPYDKKYCQISSEHFTIIFNRKKEEKAHNILNIAEAVHKRLAVKFNIPDSINTYIVLLDNTAIANGMASILPSNVIILYDAAPLLNLEKSLLNFYSWSEELIIHEYTHILHLNQANDILYGLKKIGLNFAVLNPLLPISSIEGMAVGVESYETPMGRAKSSYMDMVIRTAVYENKIPSIDEISTFANKIPNGDGPYIWGGAFHYYLFNKFTFEKIAYSYNRNSGCFSLLDALDDNKFSSCAYSCVSCFPFNSIFAANNKIGYYESYNEWIKIVKKKYKSQIASLENVIEPKTIGFDDNFAEIYNIKSLDNNIYFSGNSYDYGYGLFKYNLKLKKLQQIISDRFITDFAFYKNIIYFLDYNFEDNAYAYFDLCKYDLLSDNTEQIKKINKIISFYIKSDKLFFIRKKDSIYELHSLDLKNSKKRLIFKFNEFKLIDNIVAVEDNIFFVGKKENDFIDIYKLNLTNEKILRITDNSGIEFSLKYYNKKLYFTADYTGVFNIYTVDDKHIYRLSNVVTGIGKFTMYNSSNFYVTYYHSNGYKIQKLENLLKLPVTNIQIKNMYYTDKKIKISNVSKSASENFSHFGNMFANLIYLPLIFLQTDDSYTAGAYLYFTDILFKNMIEGLITHNPENKYLDINVLYKNNFNRFEYSLYGEMNNYYTANNYKMRVEASYFIRRLYKNFNIYSGFFYDKFLGFTFNYLYLGVRYNTEKKYRCSVVYEKGYGINIKYLFFNKIIGSADNSNILIYSVIKNFGLFFKHNVLRLKLQGGNVMNDSVVRFYGMGNNFIKSLVSSDFYLSLNSTSDGLYFMNSNYLYFISEYHFPVVWIERGILNMPLFLRNINMNLYMNNFGGYQDIKKLRFHKIIGLECNFNFYFYYRFEGVFSIGIKAKPENFNDYAVYIKLNAAI